MLHLKILSNSYYIRGLAHTYSNGNLRLYSCFRDPCLLFNIDSTLQYKNQKLRTIHTETSTGFFQTLSNSAPVQCMQKGLTDIHDYTGLPWWLSIVASTFLFRSFITFPLAIYQFRVSAKLEQIALEMPAIVTELKKEAVLAMRKFHWSEDQTRLMYKRSLKKQWNKLIVQENCHPAKTLILLWVQIPLWICQSAALRNLVYMLPNPNLLDAQLIYAELTVGGFGWIPNLTEVDGSYILPICLGILNLTIIESMLKIRPPTRLQKYATNAFRIFSLAMIPISCTIPSALCLYWVSSSFYGLLQNLVLISPNFRRFVGIPHTKSEVQKPYTLIWAKLNERLNKIQLKSVVKSNK